ncbi:MAG: alkane 1-monooxygenase [Paracoccaceae bacterium]|jgi:alkane 1-monooxygenase
MLTPEKVGIYVMFSVSRIGKFAVLVPLPFLALSPVFGGSWAFVALFYLSIFAFLADESVTVDGARAAQDAPIYDFALAAIPVVLGFAHLCLLTIAILTLALGDQSFGTKIVMFLAFSLFFGSISTANGHELIHRRGWVRATLGKWVFISLMFGHHVSAHLAVHHRHVATPLDPNSARVNEGFYRFFHRAWHGSFHAGLAVEKTRLAMLGRSGRHPANSYITYCFGAIIFASLAFVLAGFNGLLLYFAFAIIAQMQLLLSDYVQHYGLSRRLHQDGKYEPVSIFHSWNAQQVFSAALMLNAPLHSDHHARPTLGFADLHSRRADGAPVLPYSIPIMSCLALMPPIWRKVMNPKVADWQRVHGAVQN